MTKVIRWICALLTVAAMPSAIPAQDAEETERAPMIFGAASNFSQGFRPAIFDAAQTLPLRHYRDGMRWPAVERQQGSYRFQGIRQSYPERLEQRGHALVLTVNWGNPLYDGGHTPHSPEGLAAFSRYVAALVERYPAITAIEVGNEINGANFVNGPVLEAGLAERGRYHLAMVRAAREGAHSVRPDIRILGGSTHSLPAGFLWPILDDGAALLDGLALHPYTTPIDQLASQIAVLREHPEARQMPIAITEWGSADRARAPDDMLRGFASFAALGVESLYWYPLNDRGDGLVPLIERDGTISEVGETFRMIQSELGGRIARDVSPDAFTKVIAFGEDRLVLWGEARDVALLRDDVVAWDARGAILPASALRLAPDQPILLKAARPLSLLSDIALGCSPLVADSFYQFSYDTNQRQEAQWHPAIFANGRQRPLTRLPGQQRAGTPWNPYLGDPRINTLRLSAHRMMTSRRGGEPNAIIHSFTAPAAMDLHLEAKLEARGAEKSALAVSIETTSGRLARADVSTNHNIAENFSLQHGEEITVSVAPAAGQRRSSLRYRLRLLDRNACPKHNVTTR